MHPIARLLKSIFKLPPRWTEVVLHSPLRPYVEHRRRRRLARKAGLGGTTYYLHPGGNDRQDGLSPETPWQTLRRIRQTELHPGDTVLLAGEQTFKGTLRLHPQTLGTADRPVSIGSYGTGRATIDAGRGTAVYLKNVQGLHLRGLYLHGDGCDANRGSGIVLFNSLPGHIQLEHVRIDNVEATGFGKCGLLVKNRFGKSGFSDLHVTNSRFHHNGEAGIWLGGTFHPQAGGYAHRRIIIRRVEAYQNIGFPGPYLPHTGSGIVVSDVDEALIEHCVAHHNGGRSSSRAGGPVGIWAWDARRVVLQYNESYNNQTDGPKDGGGLDLDGGCSDCILQYNYSHDNDGSGYLLAQFPYARASERNIVRHNVSVNDGRRNGTSGIRFWGEFTGTLVYDNLIYCNAQAARPPAALCFWYNQEAPAYQARWPRQTWIWNNTFITHGGNPLLDAAHGALPFVFVHNRLLSAGAPWLIRWKDSSFDKLKAWSAQLRVEQPAMAIAYNTGDATPLESAKLETLAHKQGQRLLRPQRITGPAPDPEVAYRRALAEARDLAQGLAPISLNH